MVAKREIIYQTAAGMAKNGYPGYWGYAWPKAGRALVRIDLPSCVRSHVLQHELFHLRDTAKCPFLRELKANLYAFWKRPLGGIAAVIMSFQPYRIKTYAKRIWEAIR
jgi:hypothetical protein